MNDNENACGGDKEEVANFFSRLSPPVDRGRQIPPQKNNFAVGKFRGYPCDLTFLTSLWAAKGYQGTTGCGVSYHVELDWVCGTGGKEGSRVSPGGRRRAGATPSAVQSVWYTRQPAGGGGQWGAYLVGPVERF